MPNWSEYWVLFCDMISGRREILTPWEAPLGDRGERKNNHARLGSLAPFRCVLRVLIIQLWKKKIAREEQVRSFLSRPVLNVALFSKLPAGSFPGGRGVLPLMAYTRSLCSQGVPGRDFTSWSIRKDRANDKLKKGEETFWFLWFIYLQQLKAIQSSQLGMW